MNTANLYIQPKMEKKCQAHNLKVVGSNPTPATNTFISVFILAAIVNFEDLIAPRCFYSESFQNLPVYQYLLRPMGRPFPVN